MDIVWDFYLADSSKAAIRSKRGQGQRGKVLPLASLPSNWKSFLRNDENKNDSVVSSSTEAELNHMSGCTHEEADTRVFLHAADCVKQDHKKIIIRTADTDVVVLAISVVEEIMVEEL